MLEIPTADYGYLIMGPHSSYTGKDIFILEAVGNLCGILAR
jgi:hypothetical protein